MFRTNTVVQSLLVNEGKIIVKVMIDTMATNAIFTECDEKVCVWYFLPPMYNERPIIPFRINITAAYTVSLANEAYSFPPVSINEMIIATSIIVIDTAREK